MMFFLCAVEQYIPLLRWLTTYTAFLTFHHYPFFPLMLKQLHVTITLDLRSLHISNAVSHFDAFFVALAAFMRQTKQNTKTIIC